MSNFMISLFMGAGVGAWVYGRFQQRSGYNTGQSVQATAFVGVGVFLITLIALTAVN